MPVGLMHAHSDASYGSDTEHSNFNIPSPVMPSYNEDRTTQSQYKKGRRAKATMQSRLTMKNFKNFERRVMELMLIRLTLTMSQHWKSFAIIVTSATRYGLEAIMQMQKKHDDDDCDKNNQQMMIVSGSCVLYAAAIGASSSPSHSVCQSCESWFSVWCRLSARWWWWSLSETRTYALTSMTLQKWSFADVKRFHNSKLIPCWLNMLEQIWPTQGSTHKKMGINVFYHRFGNGIPGHTARAQP